MRLTVLFCFALGVLAACDSAEDGPPTVIEGTVTYQGQPLPDMWVGIRGTNGQVARPLIDIDTTDAAGHFRLESYMETGSVQIDGGDTSTLSPNPPRFYYYLPSTAREFYQRGRHHRIEVVFELGDREADI